MTEQERRDIDADISEVRNQLRLERTKWRTASTLPVEASLTIERLEAELSELRQRRQELTTDSMPDLPTTAERLKMLTLLATELGVKLNRLDDEVADLRDEWHDWMVAEYTARLDAQQRAVVANRSLVLTIIGAVSALTAIDIVVRVALN